MYDVCDVYTFKNHLEIFAKRAYMSMNNDPRSSPGSPFSYTIFIATVRAQFPRYTKNTATRFPNTCHSGLTGILGAASLHINDKNTTIQEENCSPFRYNETGMEMEIINNNDKMIVNCIIIEK